MAKNVYAWRIFRTIQWNLLAEVPRARRGSPAGRKIQLSNPSHPATANGFQRCPEYGILIRGLMSLRDERCVSSWGYEDTMLHTPRPTPTCTRFDATLEMPCIKCTEPMRLTLIEPRRRALDLLTYHCVRCDSDESFLTAR